MKYVALLRGINVSGQRKIVMKELIPLLNSEIMSDLMTYIQSGNLVFNSSLSKEEIEAFIIKQIEINYGYTISVFILNASEWQSYIDNQPIKITEGNKHHLTFLKEYSSDLIENLFPLQKDNDSIHYYNKAIYLSIPDGYGKSKLDNNSIEKKLETKATTRNWNTILKLQSLLEKL